MKRSHAYDGDTFSLHLGGGWPLVKVRLLGLDAPEHGQDHYLESKRKLARYLYQRAVFVESPGCDCYGRTLGRVYVIEGGGRRFDVNLQMVRMGYAWADGPEFRAEQEYARLHRMGLWKFDAPVAPWTYRKENPREDRYYPGKPCSPPPSPAGAQR